MELKSNKYSLLFDCQPFIDLDKFALLSDQEYNLGDKDSWFLYFRGGLIAFYSRIYGIKLHYQAVHAFGIASANQQIATEYHIANLFFNMDSAIECLIFTLNCLGYAASPDNFIDIKDEIRIKKIQPNNIWGKEKEVVKGYRLIFPNLFEFMVSQKTLYESIRDQHDVSKHRKTIFMGGSSRLDVPDEIWKELGLENNKEAQVLYAPFEEIILDPMPKSHISDEKREMNSKAIKIETIVPDFVDFINKCGEKAIIDSKNEIHLNFNMFRN
jgi:hypothetical protein